MLKLVTLVLVLSLYAAAQAPEGPAKPLPAGPMQPKVKAACTQCHNAGRLWEQHFTRAQWSDELDKMVGLGAVVRTADRDGFLNYLTTNFGPKKGSRKSPKPVAAN